jgi:hypothetical protein
MQETARAAHDQELSMRVHMDAAQTVRTTTIIVQ